MRIVKRDEQLREKEQLEKAKQLLIEETISKKHEAWKKSIYFKHVMEIIDQELATADSISLLPKNATAKELGEFVIINKAVKAHLIKIKNRLA